MARDKALWATIRADFLATGNSYSTLAKKYGVSISTLKKTAASERWAQSKDEIDTQVIGEPRAREEPERNREEPKEEPEPEKEPEQEPEPLALAVPTDEQIVDLRRERMETFIRATDGMMDRILDAIESPDVITPYALKLLASALRDIREMQGLNRTALDEEEQKARIAKLQQDVKIAEPGDRGVVVEFIATDGAEV